MSKQTLDLISELKKWAPLIVTFLAVLEIILAGIVFWNLTKLGLSNFDPVTIVSYFFYAFFFGLAFLGAFALLLIFLQIGLKGEEKALSL